MRHCTCVALILALGLFGCGSDSGGDSAGADGGDGNASSNATATTGAPAAVEPGAESPEAAMEKLGMAVDKNNAPALASMLPASNDEEKASNLAMAKMLLNMKRIPPILESAKAKYGDQAVGEALGFGGMMLAAMTPPDFQKIAKEGELTVEGDKATYKLKKEEGPGVSVSQDIKLVQKDGRWYAAIEGPPGGQDMTKAANDINSLIDSLDSAVKDSPDVDGFKKAVGEAMQKMMSASKPQGAPELPAIPNPQQ